jgi:peptidoglycan/xylan/chitin deacetylase (PgdA/CDA1 family)
MTPEAELTAKDHVDSGVRDALSGAPKTKNFQKISAFGRILAYHEVEVEKSNYIYAVTSSQLDAHLKFVAERNRHRSDETQVTFDDGHISNFLIARRLLEKHELKATFFVTVGRAGIHAQTMSAGQLRELADQGHSVQSHGWSHKFLVHCSPLDLRIELSRSKAELEKHTGALVDAISVPGGRWNGRVLRAAAEAGYQRVYTSDFWRKNVYRNGVNLAGRIMVRNDMDISKIEKRLSMDAGDMRILAAKYGLKNILRQVTGDHLYHRLWCWLAVSKPEIADKGNEQAEL